MLPAGEASAWRQSSISCTTPRPQRLTSDRLDRGELGQSHALKGATGRDEVGRVEASAGRLNNAVAEVARGPQRPENMSLYWPHSPKRTVAPAGIQVRLIPAFMNHTSFSLAALFVTRKLRLFGFKPVACQWRAVVLLLCHKP